LKWNIVRENFSGSWARESPRLPIRMSVITARQTADFIDASLLALSYLEVGGSTRLAFG